jgi:predicted transcriptional regulator
LDELLELVIHFN